MIKNYQKQNGSVSLFVVIFSALLITVVTVGFVSIMVKDQQQATATDLSQSAYDSAQAGVEDAKRAIANIDIASITGAELTKWSTDCNASVRTLTDVAPQLDPNGKGEVKIQNGNITNDLNQAYTCVKVNLDTPDYLGKLSNNEYKLILLKGTSNFDTIQIQWFTQNDANNNSVSLDSAINLPLQDNWPANKPPIIMAQLIQANGSFTLNDFDKSTDGVKGSNTLFLYPSTVGITTEKKFTDDLRLFSKNTPTSLVCQDNFVNSNYSCSVKLKLTSSNNSYLRLGSFYNKTSYRITLINSAASNQLVDFNAVQPEIDSTGRASDLFRRVVSRVELTDINFPYPNAAVEVTGSFCKDFVITDNPDDYDNSCTP